MLRTRSRFLLCGSLWSVTVGGEGARTVLFVNLLFELAFRTFNCSRTRRGRCPQRPKHQFAVSADGIFAVWRDAVDSVPYANLINHQIIFTLCFPRRGRCPQRPVHSVTFA
jgi:hypothetical protein